MFAQNGTKLGSLYRPLQYRCAGLMAPAEGSWAPGQGRSYTGVLACLFHSLGFVNPSIHGQKWGRCVSDSRSIYGNKTSFFLDQLLLWPF